MRSLDNLDDGLRKVWEKFQRDNWTIEQNVKGITFVITCTHRTEAEHQEAIKNKKTKVPYSGTAHRFLKSKAYDFLPIKDRKVFDNRETIIKARSIMRKYADDLGIIIRLPISWDLGHFQRIN